MKKKNTFREVMNKFGISNKIAAKLLSVTTSTIRSMRIDRYATCTTQKSINARAYNLLEQYFIYIHKQLHDIESYLDKNE